MNYSTTISTPPQLHNKAGRRSKLTHPTPALHTAPTPANPTATPNPQSSRISNAATLLIITAQLTADAELGRSYCHTSNNSGKSFVNELTSSAVEMSAGCG